MKYVVLHNEHGHEFPIIFPEQLVHADVVNALCGMPRSPLKRAQPVSAGFISSLNVANPGACRGESETLKLRSRGALDDALLRGRDYANDPVTAAAALDMIEKAVARGDRAPI